MALSVVDPARSTESRRLVAELRLRLPAHVAIVLGGASAHAAARGAPEGVSVADGLDGFRQLLV